MDELVEQLIEALWRERNPRGQERPALTDGLYRRMARAALSVIAAHPRYELVELAEPEDVSGDVSDWWGGDIWCTPGSGRLRVYVSDARFEASEAMSFAADVIAAAKTAEGAK